MRGDTGHVLAKGARLFDGTEVHAAALRRGNDLAWRADVSRVSRGNARRSANGRDLRGDDRTMRTSEPSARAVGAGMASKDRGDFASILCKRDHAGGSGERVAPSSDSPVTGISQEIWLRDG